MRGVGERARDRCVIAILSPTHAISSLDGVLPSHKNDDRGSMISPSCAARDCGRFRRFLIPSREGEIKAERGKKAIGRTIRKAKIENSHFVLCLFGRFCFCIEFLYSIRMYRGSMDSRDRKFTVFRF